MPYSGDYFGSYAGSYRGPLLGAPPNIFGGKVSGELTEWEMSATGSMSYSGPSGERKCSVVAETFHASHPIYLGLGIRIRGSFDELAGPDRAYTLEIPHLGISASHTQAGVGSLAVSVHLTGVKVYAGSSGRFRMDIGQIEWKTNGVSRGTFGPFSAVQVPYPLCAAAIPLIGIPPRVAGNAAGSRVFADGCVTAGIPADGWEADGTFTAGWRAKFGGDWLELPILKTGVSRLTGATTWGCGWTTHGEDFIDGTNGRHAEDIQGEYWLWPKTTYAIDRINTPDYEALIFRHGAKQHTRRAQTSTTTVPCDGSDPTTIVNDSATVVLPEQTAFLETVNNALATCEGMNGIETPIPFKESETTRDYPVSSGNGTISSTGRWFGEIVSGGADLPEAYDHPSWQIPLWNSWFNRGWLFALYFPVDSAAAGTRWKLDGTESPTLYWQEQVRQQHMRHSSLPSPQNTKHRVNVITEGITQNGFAGYWNSVHLSPAPWGIVRFSTLDRASWPTEFLTNDTSASRFHFRDGTVAGAGSVGAGGITLTTGDAIEFDLGSFTTYPYMVTSISDEIKVKWTDTNISAIRIYLVGRDSEKVLISTNPAITDTIYKLKQGDSVNWATSRQEDRGGIYTTDGYTPDAGVAADDISPATMTSAERSTLFQLLPGWSGYRLRIEIDRVNAAVDATIEHIRFYQPDWTKAEVFHETSRHATILFKEGPALRFGQLNYWDYGLDSFLPIPDVATPDLAPTMGDLWAFENHFLLGRPAITDLVTRLGAEFDVGEEHNGIIRHLWLDSFDQVTMFGGWIRSEIGPVAFYYHGYRSTIPDLTLFPERNRRSSKGWKAVPAMPDQDPYVQKSYSAIRNRMPMIHPASKSVRYRHPSTGLDLLTTEVAPTGWNVGSLVLATEGDEPQAYEVAWDKNNDGVWEPWYKSRPFSGSFNIFGLKSQVLGGLAYDVLKNIRHCIGFTDGGTIWLSFSQSNKPYSFSDQNTAIISDTMDIAYHDGSAFLYISSSDNGTISLYKTRDEGVTSTMALVVGAGDYSAIEWAPNNLLYVYRLDPSGNLFARVLDAQENVVSAENATNLSGLDQAGFDIRVSVDSSQNQIIGITYKIGGARLFKTSRDGYNFS